MMSLLLPFRLASRHLNLPVPLALRLLAATRGRGVSVRRKARVLYTGAEGESCSSLC